MFRFTRKPSSGSHSQYLAKIRHLVKSGYVELVQDVFSKLHDYTVHQTILKTFSLPTNAHNVKKTQSH